MAVASLTDVRHGYADLADVRLHYVEAGDGPLVVLLHGFPEFWYSWRDQIPALADAGYRVVAPDLRGYNLSSRPRGVSAYATDLLAADVRDLVHERGAQSCLLAGHDWGAAVAWATAINHPDVVERLAILNVPHPRRMLEGLRTLRQLARSWYMFFFQLPWLPERLLSLREFAPLKRATQEGRVHAPTPDEVARYVESWSQPGAITAMLNYYRAVMRQGPRRALAQIHPLAAPTLVIWGMRDIALGAELAEPHRYDVPNLQRVEWLPDASHWVQHDEPQRVNELLVEFFSAARRSETPSAADPAA